MLPVCHSFCRAQCRCLLLHQVQNQKRYLRFKSLAGIAWSKQTQNKTGKPETYDRNCPFNMARKGPHGRWGTRASIFTPFPITSSSKPDQNMLGQEPRYVFVRHKPCLSSLRSTVTMTTLASPHSPPCVHEPQIPNSQEQWWPSVFTSSHSAPRQLKTLLQFKEKNTELSKNGTRSRSSINPQLKSCGLFRWHF